MTQFIIHCSFNNYSFWLRLMRDSKPDEFNSQHLIKCEEILKSLFLSSKIQNKANNRDMTQRIIHCSFSNYSL